jgi:hypothetical protein
LFVDRLKIVLRCLKKISKAVTFVTALAAASWQSHGGRQVSRAASRNARLCYLLAVCGFARARGTQPRPANSRL